MPLKFFKVILQQVLGIVTYIFNTILTSDDFYSPCSLEDLKNNVHCQKSEPSNMSYYRPISVLPAPSKAIEIIMKRQINAFLMDKSLLSDYQSGFRLHHSTSMALLKITNDLLIATDERSVSLLELLDFSKAFDRVNHH
jgi:hypothetical protein